MREPKIITAGNSYAWERCFASYPSGTWTLAYSLVDESNQYNIDGGNVVASGDGFAVSLPSELSKSFAEGNYSLIGYVTNGTERKQVYNDFVRVKPNFLKAHDRREYWQKILASCQALLEDRATSDVISSTIEGDSLTTMTPEQLLVLHDRAEREVARMNDAMRAKRQGRLPGTVRVRFK